MSVLIKQKLLGCFIGLIFLACPIKLAHSSEAISIFAGKLLDVESGSYIENQLIEVVDGRISAISPAGKDSLSSDVINLSDYFVLPGLIDAHTNLCDSSYMGPDFDHWAYPAATFGIVGTVNALKTLQAGFTTVRDMSAPFYCDVALRDAIEKGWVAGPRVLASGTMMTMTGGHGSWGNWIAPQHHFNTAANLNADGADQTRQATRELIKNRVDVIKIAATGGYGTYGTIPGAASYTVEEMAAVVEEARKYGVHVAAHAHGAEGIKNAIKAGVRSIEHGSMIDEEGIRMMRKQGTFAVLDLLSAYFDLIELNQDYTDKELGHANDEEYQSIAERFKATYDGGVKIAFGTDAGVYPHGRNAEQFQLMVDAGMTPIDAIRSATVVAAELLDQSEDIGTLSVGKIADMIALKTDPLEDVSALEKVVFVMQGGKPISD